MPNPKSQRAAKRRKAGAESRASLILDQLGIREPPVPVEQVAIKLGLTVRRATLGDEISGLLVVQGGYGTIGVNASQTIVRQRFTIAHEIGHFVLHSAEMPLFVDKQFFQPYLAAFRDTSSSTGDVLLEREANAFAAALLMPADMIRHAVLTQSMDLQDDEVIDDLAKLFHVSRQAMTIRLTNLLLPETATGKASSVAESRAAREHKNSGR